MFHLKRFLVAATAATPLLVLSWSATAGAQTPVCTFATGTNTTPCVTPVTTATPTSGFPIPFPVLQPVSQPGAQAANGGGGPQQQSQQQSVVVKTGGGSSTPAPSSSSSSAAAAAGPGSASRGGSGGGSLPRTGSSTSREMALGLGLLMFGALFLSEAKPQLMRMLRPTPVPADAVSEERWTVLGWSPPFARR